VDAHQHAVRRGTPLPPLKRKNPPRWPINASSGTSAVRSFAHAKRMPIDRLASTGHEALQASNNQRQQRRRLVCGLSTLVAPGCRAIRARVVNHHHGLTIHANDNERSGGQPPGPERNRAAPRAGRVRQVGLLCSGRARGHCLSTCGITKPLDRIRVEQPRQHRGFDADQVHPPAVDADARELQHACLHKTPHRPSSSERRCSAHHVARCGLRHGRACTSRPTSRRSARQVPSC